jgi:hypothetical protein
VHRALGWVLGVSAVAVVAGAACSKPPPPAEVPKVTEPDDDGAKKAVPAVESEIGALDEMKVKQAFQRSSEKLSACFAGGVQRLPYLSGEIRFVIRVGRDGSARWAYVKESTLGDRETEACMLSVLKSSGWPKPVGGEGLAENSFAFDPGGDERPPVAWTPEQLGAPYRRAKGALVQCRKKAGTKGLRATLYVETDGKPSAIGVSGADEKGEAAVDCVLGALKGLKFPSPGSYAAKVSVTIE